jgi:hypothetical protein
MISQGSVTTPFATSYALMPYRFDSYALSPLADSIPLHSSLIIKKPHALRCTYPINYETSAHTQVSLDKLVHIFIWLKYIYNFAKFWMGFMGSYGP